MNEAVELFDVSPNAILITDSQGKIIDCNKSFKELIGIKKDKILNHSIENFVINILNHGFVDIQMDSDHTNKFFTLSVNLEIKLSITIKKLSTSYAFFIYNFYSPLQLDTYLSTFIRSFNTFIENTPDFLYIKKFNNGRHEFQIVSECFAKLCGYKRWQDLIGLDDFDVFPKEFANKYYKEELDLIKNEIIGSFRQEYKKEDGKIGTVSTTKTIIRDNKGKAIGLFGLSRDIGKIIELENQLIEDAKIDYLTKAFNRKSFNDDVNRYIDLNKKYSNPFTLVLLDIDNFKVVNDLFGHDRGDKVLILLTKLFHKAVRKEDSLYRIGGDEFAVLLPNAIVKDSKLILERIYDEFNKEVFLKENGLSLSAGVTQYISNETLKTMFKRCDKALYESKKSGKNKITMI